MQEERAGKEKMPVYKGLERFKLVDKMGEYVRPIHLDDDMILIADVPLPAVHFPMSTRP